MTIDMTMVLQVSRPIKGWSESPNDWVFGLEKAATAGRRPADPANGRRHLGLGGDFAPARGYLIRIKAPPPASPLP